ncbi:hypothetical protein QQP08_022958 [Theobroma cacao]|uniref:Uncharacterized protein n=1 Tax=Theobroma cacao TaxID=3641 RepID=A0A061FET1_THECC|nr:Uncharacterized protein TCM_034581 [Theobroma cacao]WRX30471.1 hypothetical protein QQP08_022958 [Theobroma cacao]
MGKGQRQYRNRLSIESNQSQSPTLPSVSAWFTAQCTAPPHRQIRNSNNPANGGDLAANRSDSVQAQM